ncbi:type VII toxin-antitoxin system HepT family RNase toxin [Halomonas salina]|uniref:DUF86 domain-containing protein n=1 Tax=Halomonas salina TaxID=42565 RepID=A0ABR4WVR0_9GAMM|nr:DUF86 domain-containing protein [Halomonas salina]KGE78683.1 hypothetical protein FP66_01715 [Halomonas salina]
MPDTRPSPAYLHAQRQHLADSEQDIQALETILAERSWSRLERHAAERTLQLLIESCIGLAKQWNRRETGQTSAEALTAFQRLADAGLIEAATPWRRIIGLRNVLVHDYLEVDERIVRDVIEARHYHALLDFADTALTALSTD